MYFPTPYFTELLVSPCGMSNAQPRNFKLITMKRYFYLILTSLIFAAAGCSNCYECDMGTASQPDVREYCQKDFYGEKSMFEKTIKEYEIAGYTCNKK